MTDGARADLYLKHVRGKGRGVFCRRHIRSGELVEFAPAVVLPEPEARILKRTRLGYYYFEWGQDAALIGGYGSFYNHSRKANVLYAPFPEQLGFAFVAVRDVRAGTELQINYDWFPNSRRRVSFEKRKK
jgi:SET domain-containing protein